MYSGSNDFTIREWHVARREAMRLFAGHGNGVRCALCIGQHLWSGSDDTTIKIWDLISGVTVETLTAHTESVTSLVSSGRHIWSASADKTIRVWTVTPEEPASDEPSPAVAAAVEGGGHAGGGAAGGGRKCVKVIAGQEASWRPGSLVSMGQALWAPTGKEISSFDPRRQACVGTLSPPHQGFITQLCRVRQTETRILWSYSLSDKTIKIWAQETSDDQDMRQLVHELTCAQSSLTDQLRRYVFSFFCHELK